jgi:hypothetical protein
MCSINCCSADRSCCASIVRKSKTYGSFNVCWANVACELSSVRAKLVTASPCRACKPDAMCAVRTARLHPWATVCVRYQVRTTGSPTLATSSRWCPQGNCPAVGLKRLPQPMLRRPVACKRRCYARSLGRQERRPAGLRLRARPLGHPTPPSRLHRPTGAQYPNTTRSALD